LNSFIFINSFSLLFLSKPSAKYIRLKSICLCIRNIIDMSLAFIKKVNCCMKLNNWLIAGIALIASCTQTDPKEPHVIIETAAGDIELALYAEKAPKTVAAFLANVDAGVYKNTSFYRVLKNENVPEEYNTGLIQGGVFNSKTNPSLPLIEHESPRQTGLSHVSGTVSMARLAAGSASSEFFICIGDQKQFDSSSRGSNDGLGYAAFGIVKKGMSVVSKIQNKRSEGDRFLEDTRIRNIKRL
jgi:peptidyl-prolyl cis-trans isomerase A (cyclophilin A)